MSNYSSPRPALAFLPCRSLNMLNDSNLMQPVPSESLAANLTTVRNETTKLLNSSRWLFEDQVIGNFR
jgi:hypothetical protein